MWNYHVNDGGSEKRGVVLGTPIYIRSDEWLVNSPFFLSQAKKGFPVTNEALGYGKIPLIMSLPSHHITALVKPALWGYYLLDVERGYAWNWAFKLFPFFIASFLFLMLFTGNNFTISLFGSIWLFLSSAIQWWSINTEIFTWGLLSVISFIYILYSNRTRIIIFNGILLLLSAWSFAMVLYPAYQVPYAYFLLALIAAFIISRKEYRVMLDNKWIKLSVLAVAGTLLAGLFYTFVTDCSETIQRITQTVYPGARDEAGGNFAFLDLFKDNFSWFYNQDKYPPNWGNICELSSWIILSPLCSILLIYSWIKTRKINYLFIPLLAFHLIIYIWLFWGFPHFLARLTLFSNSQAGRTFFVFGFSNVIFTLLYLNHIKKTAERTAVSNRMIIVGALIFLIGLSLNYFVNRNTDRYFSKAQFFNATVFYAALNWLIIYFSERKLFQSLFYAVCLAFIGSNIFINPLNKGLDPFLDNKIYQTVSEINKNDPDQQWIVFGSMTTPNYLKAAGINCFNGVQFAPHLEKLRILDTIGQKKDVYNRYAHILAMPFVNGKDSVDFYLNGPDFYTIKMDPSSPRLKQIGIKYVLFCYKPSDAEVKNLLPVTETFGNYIYKQKDL
jgi:hypothetical protein